MGRYPASHINSSQSHWYSGALISVISLYIWVSLSVRHTAIAILISLLGVAISCWNPLVFLHVYSSPLLVGSIYLNLFDPIPIFDWQHLYLIGLPSSHCRQILGRQNPNPPLVEVYSFCLDMHPNIQSYCFPQSWYILMHSSCVYRWLSTRDQ